MSTSNTIVLAGDYRKIQSLTLATGQTPLPGTLLKIDADGKLTVHATAGGYAERLIAVEDALQGKTKNDAYVAGTVCNCALMLPGSESQVILAGGQNIAKGSLLESGGDGTLVAHTTGIPLCVATEALDLSAASAALLAVRWL